MSVQVSYKKQTALGIIGILIIFLVIEVAANVWWITQINCEFENSEIFSNINDDKKRQLCVDLYEVKTSGNEMIPNQSSETININSHGFRGEEFSETKAVGVYRIVMLGGSTMFGTGATSDNTTIPGYMNEIFEQRNSEMNIQIINAGIQAADSNSELNLIKNKLLKFSPDMIILYDGWNDLRANHDAVELLENWKSACELGKTNNFDIVITLQPIAGFGNKILTEQELEYSKSGQDYNNKPLNRLLPLYDQYENNLAQVDSCTASINLRHVFDDFSNSIYWDQGHVSDKGNQIIANAFHKNIISTISERYNPGPFNADDTIGIENETLEGPDLFRMLISNYKTPLMLSGLFSITDENTVDVEAPQQFIVETESKMYDGREISVIIELLPPNFIESENKKIKIYSFDKTNNKKIQNVTYFLSISDNSENLLREYFFVEDELLILKVKTNNSKLVEIIGEKQYAHNAYVVSEESLIEITGPIFDSEGLYEFDIDLRTIDDVENWIFTLDNFFAEITI